MLEREKVLIIEGILGDSIPELQKRNNGVDKNNGEELSRIPEKPFIKEPHVNGRRHPTGGGKERGKIVKKPGTK